MKILSVILFAAFSMVMASIGPLQADEDRHAGYYYPTPQSSETYQSSLPVIGTASKKSRIGFTVGLNAQQINRGYPPAYHIFAKGAQAQKLIIIAVEENRYNTLYRLRALLAALTANARTSPIFSRTNIPEELNFLDLCKLAGFTQVTISNGKDVAHQIFIV